MIKGILAFAIFSIISLFSYVNSVGNNNDCNDAVKICELGDYYFSEMKGYGNKEFLNLKNSRLEETNSIWLQFTVQNSGELEFVIIPEESGDDLDFVLFQSDDCDHKLPIREMTSGEVIGFENAKACIGQTGLQKMSADLAETDGCYDLDDNFLKPVFLESGNTYYLLVNNYNSNKGFSILFSGDESLVLHGDCENNQNSKPDINLSPNPTYEYISLNWNRMINDPGPVKIQIFDQTGKIYHNRIDVHLGSPQLIDVTSFPSGKYFIRIFYNKEIIVKSFLKI